MNKLDKASKALEEAVIALEDLPLNLRLKSLMGLVNNTEDMRREAIFLHDLSQSSKPFTE